MDSGLYIVTLNNYESISVNAQDPRIADKAIKVTRANCKFGKAKSLNGREKNYFKTFNERIDIIDHSTNTAYELKVSGKNTHHEFYKDLVKVLTYNEYQAVKLRIGKLVFISESAGIKSLTGRLDSKFITMLRKNHGLTIELVGI